MHPGPSTIPTNFSSGQINSPEALQQFQTRFWQAHMASIDDSVPDFKNHLLPLARIKKVMKSDPDVKVQMISAEAPILFSKACEIFITEITQRAWMNAEENKRRTLQRQDVSFAAQRSEMFDFLIDVVPREEFASKKSAGPQPQQQQQKDEGAQQPQQQQQQTSANTSAVAAAAAAQQQQAQQQQQQVQQQQVQQQQVQQQQVQQQQQQQAQQQQANAFYGDPAFHQYYAQQLAEVTGFPQAAAAAAAAAAATPEQRQAYYQQIEREQFQWLQRQTSMDMPQHSVAAQSMPQTQYTGRINENAPLSGQLSHQQSPGQQQQDARAVKSERNSAE